MSNTHNLHVDAGCFTIINTVFGGGKLRESDNYDGVLALANGPFQVSIRSVSSRVIL